MFVLSYFLAALANVIDIVLSIMYVLILVRALISWVNPDPFNPIVQFLYQATEPVLTPIRRILPSSLSFRIDISPIIAFLAIRFLQSFVVSTLVGIAERLG